MLAVMENPSFHVLFRGLSYSIYMIDCFHEHIALELWKWRSVKKWRQNFSNGCLYTDREPKIGHYNLIFTGGLLCILNQISHSFHDVMIYISNSLTEKGIYCRFFIEIPAILDNLH